MHGFLASPRRRRRLARLGLALVAVAAAIGIVIWNPGAPSPLDDGPLTPGGPEAAQEPAQPLRVTPEIRRQVGTTVERFVGTAVARRNLDEAWSLASPAMREGVSRREWREGDLPVVPYPANAIRHVDWHITYAEGDTVGVDVMVLPKRDSGAQTLVYSAELTRTGSGLRRRWLVDNWIPAATLGGAEAPPRQRETAERPAAPQPLAFDDARLSAWWFVAPGIFLALLVLTPLVFVLRGARERRRADREYRHSRGST